MLNAIKAFVEKQIFIPQGSGERPAAHALQLASAALLIEMMRLDEQHHENEQHTIVESLQRQFGLSAGEVAALMALAGEELQQATDYYQFTALIREHYGQAERLALVEQLWRVAAADGVIDKYEEHLVRRISELLYVSHGDFVRARHRVEGEL